MRYSPSDRRGKLFSVDFFYDHSCNMASGIIWPHFPWFPSSRYLLTKDHFPYLWTPLPGSWLETWIGRANTALHCCFLTMEENGDSLGGLNCPFSRQVRYSSWHLPKVGQMSLVLVREQDCAGSCLSRLPPLIHEYKQPEQEVLKQDLNITGNPPRPLFLPPSS